MLASTSTAVVAAAHSLFCSPLPCAALLPTPAVAGHAVPLLSVNVLPFPSPRSSAIPPDDLHPVLSSSRTGVSREGFRSPKATLLADADDADIEEGGEDTYG